MTTEPTTPPMAASNEAEPDQLDVARAEGGAYGVVFEDRRFTPGRKPSPDARPRGADSSYASR